MPKKKKKRPVGPFLPPNVKRHRKWAMKVGLKKFGKTHILTSVITEENADFIVKNLWLAVKKNKRLAAVCGNVTPRMAINLVIRKGLEALLRDAETGWEPMVG